ncbi:MAG: cobalamin B12-binding domain-containing protein [Lentimicrobiaceae bacterium]
MKKILGAAIGTCVHVGGLHHFLKYAETEGYQTISLGPAVPFFRLIRAIQQEKPDIIALSYRMTPEVAIILFEQLKSIIKNNGFESLSFIFGGPLPVAEVARQSKIFKVVFDGTQTIEEIKNYFRGQSSKNHSHNAANTLLERIEQKYPYPLLRHHFGRPTLMETIEGVRTIANAGVVDVISLGPDQNAQEYFFHPEKMDFLQDGAGGVPLRKPEDLEALYRNSQTGNFPLMRCYAGTQELLKWAIMSVSTIHNAWGAIPLCWYSVIDGRSSRPIDVAIREHQVVMKWYAEQGIPVEVNESHQWSLRDAHDSLAVAMAFLAAYNAKKMGVKNYVAQFMFNTPPETSSSMDIAKMLAKMELIEELEDPDFSMIREVRAGIAHFSPIPSVAQGQLAASAVISLTLKPHIIHVVGYSEGDHATYPDELINSCNIVHGVLRNCLYGFPRIIDDSLITKRKDELKHEARDLLEAIKLFAKGTSNDPWADPVVIANAIKTGLFDAPHFRGNPYLFGKITTRMINGACYAINIETGDPVSEKERAAAFY